MGQEDKSKLMDFVHNINQLKTELYRIVKNYGDIRVAIYQNDADILPTSPEYRAKLLVKIQEFRERTPEEMFNMIRPRGLNDLERSL